jgi:hypothetical protein
LAPPLESHPQRSNPVDPHINNVSNSRPPMSTTVSAMLTIPSTVAAPHIDITFNGRVLVAPALPRPISDTSNNTFNDDNFRD